MLARTPVPPASARGYALPTGCCAHRLGMSEGSVRALEDEAAILKSRAKEVAEERPRRMAEAADLAARLRSAEERVRDCFP